MDSTRNENTAHSEEKHTFQGGGGAEEHGRSWTEVNGAAESESPPEHPTRPHDAERIRVSENPSLRYVLHIIQNVGVSHIPDIG